MTRVKLEHRRSPSARTAVAFVLCVALFVSCHTKTTVNTQTVTSSDQLQTKNDDDDEVLRRAATAALGEREGTILVLDPQNGRLRVAVNPRLAFEQSFPPGSAIKPFTALAALRTGIINAESRTACRTAYKHASFRIVCSHPPSAEPFDLVHALAYSCNYYFATLAAHLSEGAWSNTLSNFGFGERTNARAFGVATANESAGNLPRGAEWSPRLALGESENFLVTPVQLLMAYAALVNGGKLYRPQMSAPDHVPSNNFHERAFAPQLRAQLQIAPAHRALLLNGLRGAIQYGTAASAKLNSAPLNIIGKTGTSTDSNNFRTQGWFVGLGATSAVNAFVVDTSADKYKIAVLVFLRRAHGAEAAEVSRPVFEAFAHLTGKHLQAAQTSPAGEGSGVHPTEDKQEIVCVRDSSSDKGFVVMRELPLEEYVRGVLSAEASVEDQLEALKAQAVVSRTYALVNTHRHQTEGCDFCSTTHCQRFHVTAANEKRRALIAQAVAQTNNLVLLDGQDELVAAYFHAACGGMTANIKTLWNTAHPAPGYLTGVRDDYCATMPHRAWSARISAADLQRALASDERSGDIGRRLNDISVVRRDETGRAAVIALSGERRVQLSGWDFKIIVGRALGWNLLKSSRFEIAHDGAGAYLFRGTGFGHGLGLCQEGAHVMARRGADFREILAHYYPATHLATHRAGKDSGAAERRDENPAEKIKGATAANYSPKRIRSRAMPDALLIGSIPHTAAVKNTETSPPPAMQSARATVSSEHFRLTYDSSEDRRTAENALRILEAAANSYAARMRTASVSPDDKSKIDVISYGTTREFVDRSGQPGWVAAVTRARRIETQPLAVLVRRNLLESTLRHEYAHVIIEQISRGSAPHWLAEGFAAHLAGEGRMLLARKKLPVSPDELERALSHPASAAEMRDLYAAAYRAVRTLIAAEGETAVWKKLSAQFFRQ